MGYGNCVLVNDTPSNLEVISDSGFYYHGVEGDADLRHKMQQLLDVPELVAEYRRRALRRAQTYYRWEDVIERHANVYRQLVGASDEVKTPELVQSGRS
jgi:glycosyltransferase involved in cell wall biosynthesis